MKRVILVYEAVPEESRIYYFPQLPDDDYKKLIKCHGHIGGTDDSKADALICDWFCDWIAEQSEYIISNLGEDINPPVHDFSLPLYFVYRWMAIAFWVLRGAKPHVWVDTETGKVGEVDTRWETFQSIRLIWQSRCAYRMRWHYTTEEVIRELRGEQ